LLTCGLCDAKPFGEGAARVVVGDFDGCEADALVGEREARLERVRAVVREVFPLARDKIVEDGELGV